MKKLIILIISIFPFLLATGCTKCINTEYISDEVTITGEYYRSAYTTTIMIPMRIGKITTMRPQSQHHSERNEISVLYKDIGYTLNDREIYLKYQDKIGQTISDATIEVKTYNNGTIKYKVIDLP